MQIITVNRFDGPNRMVWSIDLKPLKGLYVMSSWYVSRDGKKALIAFDENLKITKIKAADYSYGLGVPWRWIPIKELVEKGLFV